jgi:hypothetical protein
LRTDANEIISHYDLMAHNADSKTLTEHIAQQLKERGFKKNKPMPMAVEMM